MTTVTKIIDKIIDKMPEKTIFSVQDLVVDCNKLNPENYYACTKTLSRLEKEKKIGRIRKGLYFKPYVSPLFGEVSFTVSETSIIDYYFQKSDGRMYETGLKLYNLMKLTTQMPNVSVIVMDNPPTDFKDKRLYFKKSKLPVPKQKKYIYLLQILDCIEGIAENNIPAQLPSDAISVLIKRHFKNLSDLELEKIAEYSLCYNSKTKAILACILDNLCRNNYNNLALKIRKTYSFSTKIKINIDNKILKNQDKYGIITPK